MKTIKLMKEDRDALLKELEKMRDLCTQENRMPNQEEVEWASGKLDEIRDLESNIALSELASEARTELKSTFGVESTFVAAAPGWGNLIGEHIEIRPA